MSLRSCNYMRSSLIGKDQNLLCLVCPVLLDFRFCGNASIAPSIRICIRCSLCRTRFSRFLKSNKNPLCYSCLIRDIFSKYIICPLRQQFCCDFTIGRWRFHNCPQSLSVIKAQIPYLSQTFRVWQWLYYMYFTRLCKKYWRIEMYISPGILWLTRAGIILA